MQIDAGQERPAAGRVGLVYRLLSDALDTLGPRGDGADAAPVRLLDCGGGSGTFAVPLAVAGADVTVVDISADALATLQRRAGEAGVSALIHPVQGDVEARSGLPAPPRPPADGGPSPDRYDAVLAHGILEAVDDVAGVFATIAAMVRPGGLLSVLVGNPAAAVVARALAGELELALHELHGLDAARARVGPHAVARLCAEAGFTVEAWHGIGVFSDLVPGAALDAPGARDALTRLDADAAARAPFAEIAGRVHLLARRTGG